MTLVAITVKKVNLNHLELLLGRDRFRADLFKLDGCSAEEVTRLFRKYKGRQIHVRTKKPYYMRSKRWGTISPYYSQFPWSGYE